MSVSGQIPLRDIPADRVDRPLTAFARDYAKGEETGLHVHARAQLRRRFERFVLNQVLSAVTSAPGSRFSAAPYRSSSPSAASLRPKAMPPSPRLPAAAPSSNACSQPSSSPVSGSVPPYQRSVAPPSSVGIR